MRAALAASLAAVAAAAPVPAPCCAYGGTGAAVAVGVGAFLFPASREHGPNTTTVTIGASGSKSADPFVVVLIGASTGPDDALAGWSVSQNASGQVIRLYVRAGGAGAPLCSEELAPSPGFVPGFDLCGGAAAGAAPLFPAVGNAFSLGGTAAGVFVQPASGAALSLLTGAPSCDALAVQIPGSPLNTGALTVAFEAGQPQAPPAAWAALPAWCPSSLSSSSSSSSASAGRSGS
jgi:hypothetical protein